MSRPATLRIACQQCRRRKVKCDLNAPACGRCVRSGVTCQSSDPHPSRAALLSAPGYVEDLEAEVARLEREVANLPELQDAGGAAPSASLGLATENVASPRPPPEAAHDYESTEWILGSWDEWGNLSEADPRITNAQLAYGVDRMIESAMKADNPFAPRSRRTELDACLTKGSSSVAFSHPLLPKYLDRYLHTVHTCMPFLREENIKAAAGKTGEGLTEDDSIHVLMAESLGATLSPQYGSASMFHATQLLATAAARLPKAALPITLQTLQSLLLCTILSLFHPTGGNTWQLNGLTMQVAISLGLHQGSAPADLEAVGAGELTFWCAYVVDRLIAISVGRPFAVHDLDITAELPQNIREGTKLHLLIRLAMHVGKNERQGNSEPPSAAVIEDLRQEILLYSPNEDDDFFFQTLALQLLAWIPRPAHAKQLVGIQGEEAWELSHVFETLIVKLKRGIQAQAPAPWTAAYVVCHAQVMSDLLTRARAFPQGPFGTDAQAMRISHDVASCLFCCSQQFPGLQSLASLHDKLSDPASMHLSMFDPTMSTMNERTVQAINMYLRLRDGRWF